MWVLVVRVRPSKRVCSRDTRDWCWLLDPRASCQQHKARQSQPPGWPRPVWTLHNHDRCQRHSLPVASTVPCRPLAAVTATYWARYSARPTCLRRAAQGPGPAPHLEPHVVEP